MKRSFILGSTAVAAVAVIASVVSLVRPIQGQDKPVSAAPPAAADHLRNALRRACMCQSPVSDRAWILHPTRRGPIPLA